MMLSIQAVDLLLDNDITCFAIASSDGDFSHLAHYLREKGADVLGIGEAKAPDRFRKACSRFVEISNHQAPVAAPNIPEIDQKIAQVIRFNSNGAGMLLTSLSVELYRQFQIKISTLPEKTWRKYLAERPELYRLGEKGTDARVRLLADK